MVTHSRVLCCFRRGLGLGCAFEGGLGLGFCGRGARSTGVNDPNWTVNWIGGNDPNWIKPSEGVLSADLGESDSKLNLGVLNFSDVGLSRGVCKTLGVDLRVDL